MVEAIRILMLFVVSVGAGYLGDQIKAGQRLIEPDTTSDGARYEVRRGGIFDRPGLGRR